MANTQAMCASFKSELMFGYHQFGQPTLTSRTSLTSPTNDTFKAALYLASATLNVSTTAFTTTGEVTGTNYTTGGVTVTNATVPANTFTTASSFVSSAAYWTPSANITYTNVSLATAFDSVLIYNNTQGNRAVSVHTFGAQTITAGTLTLTMPTNTATYSSTSALIGIL